MGWDDEDDDTAGDLYEYLDQGDAENFGRLLRERPEFLRFEDGSEAWMQEAVQMGALPIVKLLVEMGIGVNEPRSQDSPTQVPLVIAAEGGYYELVKWLLDHGAHVNIEWNGQNSCFPLLGAARNGYLDIVKLLIERGANTDFIWNGRNVTMEARGQEEIYEYLKSIGIPDLREITPPDFPGSHQRIIKIVTKKRGKLGDWTYEIPGSPVVTIHVFGPGEKSDEKTLFTTGLSDIIVKLPDDSPVATELSLSLRADWPLDEASLKDPRGNWPVAWIERIVLQTRDCLKWPDRDAALFMNSDPPQPLAPGTRLCGWVCLLSTTASHQMPDYRYIAIRGMFPIYAEEQVLIAAEGSQALVRRFAAHGVPQHIVPDRPNMADPQYAVPEDWHGGGESCDL